MPLVFPIHPRTRNNHKGTELGRRLEEMPNMRLLEPIGYLDFLHLMSNAAVAITDSGGIQEETAILGVPCMTLRENTERPVTITEGTNRLAPLNAQGIVKNFEEIKGLGFALKGNIPKFWDGKAAERIAAVLSEDDNI